MKVTNRMTYDYSTLLSAAGGDVDLANELLTTLREQIPEAVADLQTALDTNDMNRLRRTAHTLKGPLGSVGAEHALTLAHQLESDLFCGDVVGSRRIAGELQQALRALAGEMAGTPEGRTI